MPHLLKSHLPIEGRTTHNLRVTRIWVKHSEDKKMVSHGFRPYPCPPELEARRNLSSSAASAYIPIWVRNCRNNIMIDLVSLIALSPEPWCQSGQISRNFWKKLGAEQAPRSSPGIAQFAQIRDGQYILIITDLRTDTMPGCRVRTSEKLKIEESRLKMEKWNPNLVISTEKLAIPRTNSGFDGPPFAGSSIKVPTGIASYMPHEK